MPELKLEISDPVSRIIETGGKIAVAAFDYAKAVRTTMSDHARDQVDRIAIQAYWDWRNGAERWQIVGPPMPWPPPKTEGT